MINSANPDIETASPDYESRFAGDAGAYLLSVQRDCVRRAIEPFAGGTLLEVGGGHGQLVELYRELGLRFKIQGSDDACFAYALKSLPQEQRVVSDVRRLPFDDAAFDVVVAVRLITHVADWPTVMQEMCRVAKAAIVIDYPTKRSLNALTPLLFNVKKNIEGNTRTYTNFSPRDFRAVLDSSGFSRDLVVNQLFLPMVVHRVLHGKGPGRAMERFARIAGLTRLLGSPAILRAVRNSQ